MAIYGKSFASASGTGGAGGRIKVNVDTGAVVTATKGGETVTGTSVDGSVTIKVRSDGEWTLSAAKDGMTTPESKVVPVPQEVTLLFADPTLNNNTWAQIKGVSDKSQGANIWAVGDRKSVVLNGSVGYGSSARTFSNQEYWVYIIGFDHNETKEGKGIAFQGFKTAQSGGTDIAVTGTNYGATGSGMIMNLTAKNAGGWNGSWAYSTCMGQWKNCFPSDLQAVIRTTTLYTDNTGNGSTSASAVTANSNEVYYLAEYEVFGSNTYANTNEPAQQAQYAYYQAGNSKVKYRSDNTSTAARWWFRSPSRSSSSFFCYVYSDGSAYDAGANYSFGSAPAFKV